MRKPGTKTVVCWTIFVVSGSLIGYAIAGSSEAAHQSQHARWDGGFHGKVVGLSPTTWKFDEIFGDSTSPMTVRLATVRYSGDRTARIIVPQGKTVGSDVRFWKDIRGNITTTRSDDNGSTGSIAVGALMGFVLGALIALVALLAIPKRYWWRNQRRWWNRLIRRYDQQPA